MSHTKTPQELIAQIKELENENKQLKSRKKFGLVWEDKPEDVVLECTENIPVLKEVKNRKIVKDNFTENNLLIEGDNYHALSVLNYTHKGKIDVIYIDPPYNTGDTSWKYNNNYIDVNDEWRHSKWLSMMNERLKLSKNLLKNDGVLICAIDKNEQDNLSILLKELFTDHEIHPIVVVHNPRGVQGKNFSYTNEYAYFVIPKNMQVIGNKKRKHLSKANLNLRDKGVEGHLKKITHEMKQTAADALAELVKNPSENNIIPDPFYPNLSKHISDAILHLQASEVK
jgi:adenine-specific DNA-methyltransferase